MLGSITELASQGSHPGTVEKNGKGSQLCVSPLYKRQTEKEHLLRKGRRHGGGGGEAWSRESSITRLDGFPRYVPFIYSREDVDLSGKKRSGRMFEVYGEFLIAVRGTSHCNKTKD